MQSRTWVVEFTITFPKYENRASVYARFHKLRKWLESQGCHVLVRLEPKEPEEVPQEDEPADFYAELGF